MATILRFAPPVKFRPCRACGTRFEPRQAHHKFCLKCFSGAIAIAAFRVAGQFWRRT